MKNKLIFLFLYFAAHITAQSLSANEVIDLIKDNVTVEWTAPTVDTIKAGNGETKVSGIVTTFMASMEVLEKAVAENCNLIITHEPTFYNHFDNLERLEDDPVQKAKLDYINEHDLVIFRFHDYIHRTDPDGIYKGFIRRIGWEDYQRSGSYVFDIPEQTLASLRQGFADLFDSGIIRGLGNKNQKVSKVGMVLGAAGFMSHVRAIQSQDIDVLLIGEGVEWETIPYFQDANTQGFLKGLIILGHADSEEAGMEYCAEWLKSFVPDTPIMFIPSGNPMWSSTSSGN